MTIRLLVVLVSLLVGIISTPKIDDGAHVVSIVGTSVGVLLPVDDGEGEIVDDGEGDGDIVGN